MALENKNIDCTDQTTDKTIQQIKEEVWSTIMRIFKSDGSPGIEVSKNNKGESVVFYPGKYSYKTPFFSLDRKNPPEIIDGKIFSGEIKEIAWISKTTQKPFSFFIISKGKGVNTQECLIFEETYDPWKNGEEIVKYCFYKFKKGDAFINSISFGRWRESYYFANCFDGEKIVSQNIDQYLEQERFNRTPEVYPEIYSLFTWRKWRLNSGISDVNSKIVLGENGRGRSHVTIPVYKNDEIQKNDFGNIEYFSPSTKEKCLNEYIQREMIELIGEKSVSLKIKYLRSIPSKYLVLIDTERYYTQWTHGEIKPLLGNPKIIINGIKAHGGTGTTERIFQWLVAISEGDVLLISPEGGRKTKRFVLYVKDGKLTQEDYYPRMQRNLKGKKSFLGKKLPSMLWNNTNLIGKKISFFCRETWHWGKETSPYGYYYNAGTFEDIEIKGVSENGLIMDLIPSFELTDDNGWILNE